MTDIPPGKQGSQFVWVDGVLPGRNQFVRFIREVWGAGGKIKIFADTRYRLSVNGVTVFSGPARFVTRYPEYDEVDLDPWLGQGCNRIEVLVNFFGASSFQSMPDGRPGFWACGFAGDCDLSTPGEWKAEWLNAWQPDAPLFSFAQNPVEICDTRLIELGKPCALRVLEAEDCPWGEPVAYSGQPLGGEDIFPRRVELAATLSQEEKRFGFVAHDSDFSRKQRQEQESRSWVAFRTWIWSPCDQDVNLSCFWSELYCNGEKILVDTDTPYGNHGHALAPLRAGWNLLAAKVCVLTEHWTYCLGVPIAAGLELRAFPDLASAGVFQLSPVLDEQGLILPPYEKAALPEGWRVVSGDYLLLTPARMMAWDIPNPDGVRELHFARLPDVGRFFAMGATWTFSFQGAFLGYPVIEVDAPEGTVMDIAYDDWLSPNGMIALYRSNPFTDSADRFILRGGRQVVELYHPRGGKYLQITLRAAHGEANLSIHGVRVRSRTRRLKDESSFRCDDEVSTWLWPVALRTLLNSTDEAYADCPWRERACYVGDLFVNLHIDALLTGDLRTAKRCLRQFAQSTLPDGQIACCTPSWLRKAHHDYTLIWILALRDYWALSGDLEFISEMLPTVDSIWASSCWKMREDGLWSLEQGNLFIDWGVLKSERQGAGNAVLNLLRLGALRACGELCDAAGMGDKSSDYYSRIRQLEVAIFERLWDEKNKRFRSAIQQTTPALHANVLALFFKVGSAELRKEILNSIEEEITKNFDRGLSGGQFGGHLELYFFHYLLPALAENGRPDLAEKLIKDHYGFLMKKGEDTLPECFCRIENFVGSRCHSWSGAGAVYAARYILGLKYSVPGDTRKLSFRPIISGISKAEGRIAHPRGWIDVSWYKKNGDIVHQISLPQNVVVEIDE